MPLVYQQNINAGGKLAIWHIQEAESFFLRHVAKPPGIQHPHKRLQHLAARYLLKTLEPSFPLGDILISETNKPYLPGSNIHFSISHCADYAAVIINPHERAGIDIETFSEKVLRVKHKFMNREESGLFPLLNELNAATLVWSIKESVFKWFGTGKVDFKEHIRLKNATGDGISFEVYCEFSKEESTRLSVKATVMNGFCLAWVVG